MDRNEIIHHYLTTWFAVDILGSFPFEKLTEGMQKSNRKSIKMWKILKLAKLLRISKLLQVMRRFYKWRHAMLLLIVLPYLCHWLTCLWYLATDDTGLSDHAPCGGVLNSFRELRADDPPPS